MSRFDARTYRPDPLDTSTSTVPRFKTWHGYQVDSEAVADAILRTPLLADYRLESPHDRRRPGRDRLSRGSASAPVVFDADHAAWVRPRWPN